MSMNAENVPGVIAERHQVFVGSEFATDSLWLCCEMGQDATGFQSFITMHTKFGSVTRVGHQRDRIASHSAVSTHFFPHCCFIRLIRSNNVSFDIRVPNRSISNGNANGDGLGGSCQTTCNRPNRFNVFSKR